MNERQFSLKNVFSNSLYRYIITGGVGFLVDMSVTYILKDRLYINQYAANVIGVTTAILSNFMLNKYWTFKDKDKNVFNQLVIFIAVSLVGLVLNTYIIYLFVTYVDIDFYLGKLMAIFIVFFWNYFINKYFVFNEKNKRRT